MGVDDITAFETGNGFFQVLAQYQLEFRIFPVGLKKSVLAQALVNIVRFRREIFHGNKLLVGTHEHLEQLDNIQPIIFLPLCIAFQPEIEISGGTWNVTVSDPTAFKTGNAITWTASGTGTAGATKVGVTNATDLLAINLADLFPSVSNGAINANVISGSCTAVWYTADASTVAAVTGAPGFGADAQHAWATDPFAWDNSTAGITTDGFTVGTAPVLSLG